MGLYVAEFHLVSRHLVKKNQTEGTNSAKKTKEICKYFHLHASCGCSTNKSETEQGHERLCKINTEGS